MLCAAQVNLFNEAEITAKPEQDELPLPDTASKNKTGRKPFSDKLPREQVFAYLSEKDKAGAIDTFFVKVREELDIIPAQVRVLEYMQEKAVCKDEQDKRIIKAAEVILPPVAKAMGSGFNDLRNCVEIRGWYATVSYRKYHPPLWLWW